MGRPRSSYLLTARSLRVVGKHRFWLPATAENTGSRIRAPSVVPIRELYPHP
jgi:hypothetical protein